MIVRTSDVVRGDIFYIQSATVEGCEQRAGRPAVVVSNNKGNEYGPVVEVVYLTTQDKKPLPTHVDIVSAPYPSIALCEQVNTISKNRLGQYIGRCTDKEMTLIDGALCVSLGIEVVENEKKREVCAAIMPTLEECKAELVREMEDLDKQRAGLNYEELFGLKGREMERRRFKLMQGLCKLKETLECLSVKDGAR